MSTRCRSIVSVVLAAAGLAIVAGCSNEIDSAELEGSIRKQAEEAYAPFEVGEVDCPEGIELEEGNVFECDLEIEDATVDIEVTQEDDDGNVTIEQTDAALDVAKIAEKIAEGLLEQTGVEATVDCGDSTVLALPPGDTFECAATPTDGSAGAVVDVRVVDVDGNVEWELV